MKPQLFYYADDDIDDLNLFTEACNYFGHETKEFFNGHELINELKKSEARPNLIFLDYYMPMADGLEIIQMLNELGFGEIPVVMITGICPVNLQRQFLDQGVKYIIAKPVNFTTYKSIIETLSDIDWANFKFDVESSSVN